MNASDSCHEVADVPGLYIDAFRGRLLRKTQDPDACFILTHYHGDHYQNLPKEGRYTGPAKIHCSPVTAALLNEMHQVPSNLVVAHDYGTSFECVSNGTGKDAKRATITFYDANHCPGACIVLIQLPNGKCHLHTGDMRYCDNFKSYPLLRDAVAKNRVDLVYLDTTYSHPKHDFVPQEEAIETIATQTQELLSSQAKVLVLLSCYSIGKEKVLWEASVRAGQKLFVSERKLRMLKCIQLQESQESYQLINRCTEDPSQSDIHVIPMGVAGEMWPYFRPNFVKCKDYVEELDKDYDKVVAFLPTGWANASNWNKRNAVSKKVLELESGKPLDVEIRLISYSEHSAFPELINCVQFLKPRKVIPTVFIDEADSRKIQDRFRHLIDSKRAKQAFFRSMERSVAAVASSDIESRSTKQPKREAKLDVAKAHNNDPDVAKEETRYDSDIEILEGSVETPVIDQPNIVNIACLVGMGFEKKRARSCLLQCNGNLQSTIETLLSAGNDSQKLASPKDVLSPRKRQRTSSQITSFFSKKKS